MLDTSEQHIRNLVRGIREHIPERYTESDVFGRSKVAVRFVALQDYANHGGDLDIAPSYRPVERERELGIISPAQNPHDIALEIVKETVRMFAKMEVV